MVRQQRCTGPPAAPHMAPVSPLWAARHGHVEMERRRARAARALAKLRAASDAAEASSGPVQTSEHMHAATGDLPVAGAGERAATGDGHGIVAAGMTLCWWGDSLCCRSGGCGSGRGADEECSRGGAGGE